MSQAGRVRCGTIPAVPGRGYRTRPAVTRIRRSRGAVTGRARRSWLGAPSSVAPRGLWGVRRAGRRQAEQLGRLVGSRLL